MIYAMTASRERIRAVRGAAGLCPGCGEALIPKCGEINVHHWSHRQADCDPWYEPETAWHLGWKSLVRPEATEVVIGPHRADIVGNGGVVIELQHSAISTEEITAREQFYGEMIWVIDALPFRQNFGAPDWKLLADRSRVAWFDWLHPHLSLVGIQKPLFFDLRGQGMWEVLGFGKIGRRITTETGERQVSRWRCRAKPFNRTAFQTRYLSGVMAEPTGDEGGEVGLILAQSSERS